MKGLPQLLLKMASAAILGAVAASFVVGLMLQRHLETSQPADRPTASAPAVTTELVATVEELREENRALRARLATLEQRPAPAAREPAGDFVSRRTFAEFEQEVRAWMVTEPAVIAPLELTDAPELREEVEAALKTIRKDEAVERALKANDDQTAKLEERVGKVAEWLSLNAYQSDEVRAILRAKDARERDIIERWKRGEDDETLARLKHRNTVVLHDEFERVLGPDQLEKLNERFQRPEEKR